MLPRTDMMLQPRSYVASEARSWLPDAPLTPATPTTTVAVSVDCRIIGTLPCVSMAIRLGRLWETDHALHSLRGGCSGVGQVL